MTVERALDSLVDHVTRCDVCRTILDFATGGRPLCHVGESFLALVISYRVIEQDQARRRGA